LAISFYDQNVAVVEPTVKFAKSVSAGFNLDTKITSAHWDDDIARKATTDSA
jgi:hypothetical protein